MLWHSWVILEREVDSPRVVGYGWSQKNWRRARTHTHTHKRVQAKHIKSYITHRPQYNHSLFFTKPTRSHETVRDEFVITIDRMTSSPSQWLTVTTLKQPPAHTHSQAYSASKQSQKTVLPLQRSVPLKQINHSSPIVLQTDRSHYMPALLNLQRSRKPRTRD